MRRIALYTLGGLKKTALEKYAPRVFRLLGTDTRDVQIAALNTLGKLDQNVLATYANRIILMLMDETNWWPELMLEALETLGKLNRTNLAKCRDKLVKLQNYGPYLPSDFNNMLHTFLERPIQ